MPASTKPIPFSPPDITEAEIQAVAETLRSGWITTGPRTKELEQRLQAFTGADGFACLNSATAALECALRVLGIGPGDEVITSAYTYTASASPIHHVGAKIVLVDTAPGSYEMDYMALGDAKRSYQSTWVAVCAITTNCAVCCSLIVRNGTREPDSKDVSTAFLS